ncbi:alpha-ketoglutaric semialdehyde dehydrogenase [Nephila pilipes]|uniref:Alpha-ketoglutaric semialdehyde dehydrogenase n=1 Tax=Nephila pilipes TaxID=299642 RepID=A0A8X6UKF8_NEPPI|nr:alpha-ketoglutaric semialdehyde dehydrogenase [Nephila pilipes]
MTALQGIPCEMTISRQPVVIVYENADLHSATDSVLEILYYSDTRSERSGCKVFVQSSIQQKFLQLLERKFADTSIGVNLSKTDMTCIVTREQKEKLIKNIEEAKNHKVKVVQGPDVNSENGQHRAALLSNLPITSNLLCEVGGGPIVVIVPFRTVKESITMFNHDKIGNDVSIWSEKLTLALEVAHQLKAGTVWVNSQNLFDASTVYGGMGVLMSSLEGGNETITKHLNFGISELKKYSKEEAENEITSYGKELPPGISIKSDKKIKRIYELYIGGSYKNGNTDIVLCDHKQVPYAYVANGSLPDVEAAVSSATAAQSKWERVNKYKRFEILRKSATMLSGKKDEFATILHDLTGEELNICKEEIDKSVACLHYWSIHVATSCGEIVDTPLYGKVLKDYCPLGVIGIQSPDKFPLLSYLSLVSSAIAVGNAVVVIPSENCPIPALKMCEIFKSAGVPNGIVNVITGGRCYLTRQLMLNLNINAVWFGVDGAAFIYHSCGSFPRRTFDCKNIWKLEGEMNSKLFLESTQIKTTYMPMGTIFGN